MVRLLSLVDWELSELLKPLAIPYILVNTDMNYSQSWKQKGQRRCRLRWGPGARA